MTMTEHEGTAATALLMGLQLGRKAERAAVLDEIDATILEYQDKGLLGALLVKVAIMRREVPAPSHVPAILRPLITEADRRCAGQLSAGRRGDGKLEDERIIAEHVRAERLAERALILDQFKQLAELWSDRDAAVHHIAAVHKLAELLTERP